MHIIINLQRFSVTANPSPYLEYSDEFVQISYLNQIQNNKKAGHIRQLAGKHPDNYYKCVFVYEIRINAFKNYKYWDEYAGILYTHSAVCYVTGIVPE
jgi:hypothetical protein